MHISAFVDIHYVAVARVVDKVTPWHLVGLASDGEVIIPSKRLGTEDGTHVSAAGATAVVDEGIVIDILVTELTESVSTSLMLYHAS